MQYELSKIELCEESYREGYKDAVKNYSIWKDGEQLVGCMATPLKVVINEINNSPNYFNIRIIFFLLDILEI